MSEQLPTLYEAMGGAETIRRLVDAFYDRVAKHPDLRPLFPDDFTEVRRRQYAFLTQFFGGPPLYTQEHGNPMLRARHLRFPVTPKRANAWLACMSEAMDEVGIQGDVREQAFSRLIMTAYHMVNTMEDESETGE